jgi:hypothetical protein
VLAAVSTLLTLTSLLIGFVTYRLQSREQPPA